jgi:uncharacterized glyoxalase superfamily protein PhnB
MTREWFEKAADKGATYALSPFREFYANRQGVAQDRA